ncbi:uncharacterized protein MYCGRDRAFT_92595 [Zymoseptoria tritici IPO323]|uniref:Oxysterol-binding protein n=1 Tax=Zymoseptoria tritici (strain CBS 115943 / IPO323) TaxID=336722 RepID=F9X8F7_ZYMTI|nr:uncharacterized protein MYCGRDRAFT_92595 [Zymoseptoria tritici IPO323]EGP88373.1 hypothetical protein MYCGRDRAFT_92595 [Zymoseptoria tritici IPO323]
MADNSAKRSSLKEFIASIATIKGDLSNITAPPFVLAPTSTTEFPRFWISHPSLFLAAATLPDPESRILAVLKWFLASLKDQQFAGRDPTDGIKKPLNAFLGEVFIGETGKEGEETKLISEQVSHHPPVTACYLWNEKHGVRAEGYTRQQITFSTTVNIQQTGHALLSLDHHSETYLIPLPQIKVKGILTGSPYPELDGNYTLASSSGYVAEVDFTGKGMLGLSGKKNHLSAHVYAPGDDKRKDKNAVFSVDGSWSEGFEVKDSAGKVVDSYDVASAQPEPFRALPLEQQDPWESRKAWNGVITAIDEGNMQGVADAKSEVENAQREMRKRDGLREEQWTPLFFEQTKGWEEAERLVVLEKDSAGMETEKTEGVWRFRKDKAGLQRPWRGELTPLGR